MEDEQFKKIGQYLYSGEAYIYKGKLESEGIEVFIRDNHTIETDPMVSNAIGGVKLFVRTEDYDKAHTLLSEISKYSLDDSGKPLSCPDCGSTNNVMLTTITTPGAFFAFLVSIMLTVGLPFYTKYKYKCSACGFEFETRDKRDK